MARGYSSPTREAKAEATRVSIVEAFVAQLWEADFVALSPKAAAAVAGVSVRTVHHYFPDRDSQVLAVAAWAEAHFFPDGIALPTTAEQIPDFLRAVHRAAAANPDITRVFVRVGGLRSDIRASRRRARLTALRSALDTCGAPADRVEELFGVLGLLAGAETTLHLLDAGIAAERVPHVVAEAARVLLDAASEDADRFEPAGEHAPG